MAKFESYLTGLSFEAALKINAILICAVLGMNAPIFMVYFVSQLTPQFVANFGVAISVLELVCLKISRNKTTIRWVSGNFMKMMILIDGTYFILATLGENEPILRWAGIQLIGVIGVDFINIIRKDNINNLYEKTDITVFNQSLEYWKSVGGFIGIALSVVLTNFIDYNITVLLYIEAVVCCIGHGLQGWANHIARKKMPKETPTIIEVINDIFRSKK